MATKISPMSKQQSLKYVRDLLKTRSGRLTNKDYVPGSIVMFYYNAKDQTQTYDKSPLVLVLYRNKRHTLGVNFHWAPIPLRVLLIKKILSVNKNNIKLGKPLEFDYEKLRPFMKKVGFAPIIRKYINSRMSRSGVKIPPDQLMNIARTKSETFTSGKMSAEELYKQALRKNKQYRSSRKRRN